MPRVHVTRSIAFTDGASHQAGETVDMTAERTQEALRGGWGELVRDEPPQTPERARAQRSPAPERRARTRGGGYRGDKDGDAMGPPPSIPSGAVRAR